MEQEVPSGPKLEFEAILTEFVDHASVMMRSQSRLRDPIRINNELTSNLDLTDVLRRVVEVSKELLGARYAAMGVIGDERRLEQFIHVGMPEEVSEKIAHLPEGKGLLGALIDDPSRCGCRRSPPTRGQVASPPITRPMNNFHEGA